MVRVLFLMGSMGIGGAETCIMKIYRNIDRYKMQFDFLLYPHNDEEVTYENEILSLGGKIYRVTPKTSSLCNYIKELKNIIRQNDYKVILKCSESSDCAIEMFVAKMIGVKVRAVRSTNSKLATVRRSIVHKLFQPFLNIWTNFKIAPSTEAAEWMFGKHTSFYFLKNGIDISDFSYSAYYRDIYRNNLGISKDHVLIGNVGRLSQQKNHIFLLEVFKKLLFKEDKYRLILIGTGPLEDVLKEKCKSAGIESKVYFLGQRKDVNKLLSALDIFVFPSLYEGMPNTVIEAQTCGLPCVISDTITEEVAITDLVSSLSLSDIDIWTETIKRIANTKILFENRSSYSDVVKTHGYDIKEVSSEFEKEILDRLAEPK